MANEITVNGVRAFLTTDNNGGFIVMKGTEIEGLITNEECGGKFSDEGRIINFQFRVYDGEKRDEGGLIYYYNYVGSKK